MKWKDKLIKKLIDELNGESVKSDTLNHLMNNSKIGVHLAVFNEPFLALLYKGEKEIESRFSINKVSPFNKVSKNDVVILKSSGGPVSGFFIAGDVQFYSNLNNKKLNEIKRKFGKKICADYDPNFWTSRDGTNYATLIEVKNVTPLNPFKIEKKDRSAWSVLQESRQNLLQL